MDVKPEILGLDYFLICEEQLVPLACTDISVYGQRVHVLARIFVLQGWTAPTLETLPLCLTFVVTNTSLLMREHVLSVSTQG